MNTIITNDTLVARHISAISYKTGSPLMGASKALLIEEAKRQMRNGVCHFIYMKKNGECREAFGTLVKGVLNATLKGTGESPDRLPLRAPDDIAPDRCPQLKHPRTGRCPQ